MAPESVKPSGRESREQSFAALKEQQLVFLLTRHLAEAQFLLADRQRSERLWQEVAALEIDPERITALLYGGLETDDREVLRRQDDLWLAAQVRPVQRGWSLRTLPVTQPWQPKRSLTPA